MMGPRLPVCYFFSNIYPGATGMGVSAVIYVSPDCAALTPQILGDIVAITSPSRSHWSADRTSVYKVVKLHTGG